jgi:invasion protein IalB
VTFSTGSDAVTLSLTYQEMDGMHAADAGLDDPLIQLLKAGDTVTIKDVPEQYPVKHFSLKGSSTALDKLVADCG